MIYLTSDQHFGHIKIMEYENRPFKTVSEMNDFMITQWNKTVSNKDTVYVLGDFAWGNKEAVSLFVSMLNGYKILIKGNHDKNSKTWYHDAGFNDVIDGGIILDDFYLLTHKPLYMNENMPFVNIHGHTHSMCFDSKLYVNVGVDVLNYKPILFNEIKERYKDGDN